MPRVIILAGNYMLKWNPIRPLITLGWGNSRGFLGCQAPAGDAHHYSPNQREASSDPAHEQSGTKGVPERGDDGYERD